jgi:hypothetical protein
MNLVIRYFLIIFAFCLVLCNLQQHQVFGATSIKKLLGKAKPGQTIRIPSGTFVEDVIVPAGVSLVGAMARKTIIIGSIKLSAMSQTPVSLSRVTVIHTGSRISRAVSCDGGNISIYHSHLISEGGFATIGVAANTKVLLRNNIIVGPVGDYAVFGRNQADINLINNTIIVQGFGVGLMDKSFATIRNCLFFGDAKPAVIRTDSDYLISFSNISLSGGSFYFNHDLINGDIKLRDSANYPNDATPTEITNKDISKYDSLGLTFLPFEYTKFKTINEYRKSIPDFAKHTGSPNDEDKNADGSRNNLGAFGGAFGDGW